MAVKVCFSISVCKPVSYLMSHYQLPFLSTACTDSDLDDKRLHKTFVRLSAPFSKTGHALITIFKHYGWKKMVVMVGEKLDCLLGGVAIEDAIKHEANMTVVEWIKLPGGDEDTDVTDQELDEYLKRASTRSRSKMILILLAGLISQLIEPID